MRHTVKTQMWWDHTTHILRDYLLNTSIPLIFETLLQKPDSLGNKNWHQFMHPAPNKDYKPTELHFFVWEYIFKNSLIMVFRDRLLGSQKAEENYVKRSEKYAALFNDMIGRQDCSTDLPGILEGFYDMTRDYLSRNLPGRKADYEGMGTRALLTACRDAYRSRRLRDDTEEDRPRDLYVDFEGHTYSSAMLDQFDEMAERTSEHPNSRHFIILGEMLVTLFMYVYMVEYIKKYPILKGEEKRNLTDKERTGQSFNLFAALADTGYKTLFFKEKERREQSRMEYAR